MIEYWDEIWNSYDRKRYDFQLALEEHSVRWQRIKQIIFGKFESLAGLKCLEIGAESGHYLMLFARNGARVTLLDYSEKALEFCQGVFKDNCVDKNKVEFIQMDV